MSSIGQINHSYFRAAKLIVSFISFLQNIYTRYRLSVLFFPLAGDMKPAIFKREFRHRVFVFFFGTQYGSGEGGGEPAAM